MNIVVIFLPVLFRLNQALIGKLQGELKGMFFFSSPLMRQQILDLAVHLTQCKIDFYFSTPRVIVLDLNGVSSATLVRLFQYAEIPIPTSMTQGAFSVSFMNAGEEGYSNLKADRELTKINVTWGRISAISSVPAPIKISDLQKIATGSGRGRLRPPPKLLAGLVDAVIILLGIGRGGARSL